MKDEDLIYSIISVLAVDGDVNAHEMEFFTHICDRLEIDRKTRNMVLQKARQGKGRVHFPDKDADKNRLLYFLIRAVVSDGTMTPAEKKVLDAVVARLGFSKENIENFIEQQLQAVKEAQEEKTRKITCPKCGYEQPVAQECRRCGLIFEKYKQVKGPSDEDRLRELLSVSNVIQE